MSRVKYLASCVMHVLIPRWLDECERDNTTAERRAAIEGCLVGDSDAWRTVLRAIAGKDAPAPTTRYRWAHDEVRAESDRLMQLSGGPWTWVEDGDADAIHDRTYAYTGVEIQRDLKNTIMCDPGRTSRFLKWIRAEAAILASELDPVSVSAAAFRRQPLRSSEAKVLHKGLHTDVVPSFKDDNGNLLQAGTPRHIALLTLLAHLRSKVPEPTEVLEGNTYMYDHFELYRFWHRALERILSVGEGEGGDAWQEEGDPEDAGWDPEDEAFDAPADGDGDQQSEVPRPPPPLRRIKGFTLFPIYRGHQVSAPGTLRALRPAPRTTTAYCAHSAARSAPRSAARTAHVLMPGTLRPKPHSNATPTPSISSGSMPGPSDRCSREGPLSTMCTTFSRRTS